MNNLSKDMSVEEQANWMSFFNAVKFIDSCAKDRNVELDENDLDTRSIINYINSVSGDIQHCLHDYGGIPYKYSLDSSHEESHHIDEVLYN